MTIRPARLTISIICSQDFCCGSLVLVGQISTNLDYSVFKLKKTKKWKNQIKLEK